MPDTIRYPDVQVQLTGRSGNAFAIIGAVAGALRREVSAEAAAEFSNAAMGCGSYDELLQLAMSTVDVC
jgi:hypothetical protein